MKDTTIGQEVIRSKGDYVVGRIGNVIAIDTEKQRAQVAWNGETKTWVSFGSLEPTSIPYEIVIGHDGRRGCGFSKYRAKAAEQFVTEKVMYNGKEHDAINFGKLLKRNSFGRINPAEDLPITQ